MERQVDARRSRGYIVEDGGPVDWNCKFVLSSTCVDSLCLLCLAASEGSHS